MSLITHYQEIQVGGEIQVSRLCRILDRQARPGGVIRILHGPDFIDIPLR